MKGKSTKSALLMSFTSLLLCFAMLIGCTFAWFTDSVTSGVNKIQAGNLDIDVQYTKDNGTNWTDLQNSASLFGTDKWEPGHTEYVTLKITNKGTLALKYDLKVSPVSESGGINVEGNPFKLSDHIRFGTTAPSTALTTYTRDSARAAIVGDAPISGGMKQSNEGMLPNAVDYITLVVYMPTEVGNDANYKTGTAAPFINLGITVLATQVDQEVDSFNNDYDAGRTNDDNVIYNYFEQIDVAGQVKVGSGSTSVAKGNEDAKTDVSGNTVTVKSTATDAPAATVSVAVKPKDGAQEGDIGSVSLKVAKTDNANFTVEVPATSEVTTFDVEAKVTGAIEVDANALFTVKLAIGAGKQNLMLYHGDVEMTNTDTGAADTFTYNPATGFVTMYVDHFSEFTAVYDEPVAAIGTTAYYSLESAIAAANPGDTVTLLKDITLTEAIVIPNDKSVTFNGNGKTVTVNANGGKAAFGNEAVSTEGLKESAQLTVKNTNFVSSTPGQNYAVITGSGFCGRVTMENCSFKNMHTAVLMNPNGTETAAQLKIENCTYSNTSWGYSIDTTSETSANVSVNFANNSGIGADKEFEVFPGKVAVIKSANALPKQYETLKDAIAAVTNGQTIELMADLTVGDADKMTSNDAAFGIFNFDQLHSSPSSLNAGNSVTLDGKGHSITVGSGLTVSGSLNSVFGVVGNLKVNFKNLTVDANGRVRHVFNAAYNPLPEGKFAGTVTFENCTAQNGTGYGLVVNNFNATVNSLTTSGNGWGGINVDNNANATIMSANCAESNGVKVEGGSATISGGTFDTVSAAADASLTITGGTFSSNPSEYVKPGCTVEESGGIYTVVPPSTASSAEELSNVFATGGTVMLAGDIAASSGFTVGSGAEVVIDLSGHTLNVENDEGGDGITVTGGGTLTLKDSSDNPGKLVIKADDEGSDAIFVYNNDNPEHPSVLNIENIIIDLPDTTETWTPNTIHAKAEDGCEAIVNVNDGAEINVAAESNAAIIVDENAVVNMSGGTINAEYSTTTQTAAVFGISLEADSAVFNMTGGVINVSGGHCGSGIVTWGDAATIIITRGEFNIDADATLSGSGYNVGIEASDGCTLNVSGATFNVQAKGGTLGCAVLLGNKVNAVFASDVTINVDQTTWAENWSIVDYTSDKDITKNEITRVGTLTNNAVINWK